MTKVDLIKLIGDVLRRLDSLRKSQSPDVSTRPVLDELRNTLAKQQLKLAINEFDEDAPAFRDATEKILAINTELHGAIERSGEAVVAIDDVKHFIRAVD